MRTLDDALPARRLVVSGVRHAVVVGGGYIGLEVAEAFHHQGISTRVLTQGPAVLERTLDADMGTLVTERMRAIGIEVHTGIRVDTLRRAKPGKLSRPLTRLSVLDRILKDAEARDLCR